MGRYEIIRPLFLMCTKNGIVASDLWRSPKAIQQLPSALSRARAREVLLLLSGIYAARETLGFYILDSEQIGALAARIPRHERKQTPYIPPRIWAYVIRRSRECLDDFVETRSKVVELFNFCVEAYRRNSTSVESLYRDGIIHGREPFTSYTCNRGVRTDVVIHGPFDEVARRFGVLDVLSKWCSEPDTRAGTFQISQLSQYLTLVCFSAATYLQSFSLARLDEVARLRAGCFSTRNDSSGGKIYLIRGVTTKTTKDDNAYWIASESCKIAVDALEAISALRFSCAVENPAVPATSQDFSGRPLLLRAYEPWIPNSGDVTQSLDISPNNQSFLAMAGRTPKFIEPEELEINKEDLSIAMAVTPTLDSRKFKVGEAWPLAWHQFRRTGAVNMASSGLVSDQSLRLQLKHSSEMMTRYYAQGHYHLDVRLDESGRREFLNALFDVIAVEFEALQTEQFVSPYGQKHKDLILNVLSSKTHTKLLAIAKNGGMPYRKNLLGGCTNPEPCPYGGVDSLVGCAGKEEACSHLLVDRKKIPILIQLKSAISELKEHCTSDDPLSSSLEAQVVAIDRAVAWCENE